MAQLAEADVQPRWRPSPPACSRTASGWCGDGRAVRDHGSRVPRSPQDGAHDDVAAVTRANLEWFLEHVSTPEDLAEYAAEVSRPGLARRARQGVSLQAALKVVRVFGRCVWTAILDAARPDDPVEREAALRMAGRIMEYVDGFCTFSEELWLEQARGAWSEREVATPRPHRAADRRPRRQRVRGPAGGAPRGAPGHRLRRPRRPGHGAGDADGGRARRPALRREHRPRPLPAPGAGGASSSCATSEVVALHPVDGFSEVDALKEQCGPLAAALAEAGAKLGLGGWHQGAAGVSISYDEARRAAIHALRSKRAPHLVASDDLVLDQLLQIGPKAHPHLETTLRRLREHDDRSSSELLPDAARLHPQRVQPRPQRDRAARPRQHRRLPPHAASARSPAATRATPTTSSSSRWR